MALNGNPTKTRGIQRSWFGAIKNRWGAFTRSVTSRLRRDNEAAQPEPVTPSNRRNDPFALDASQQRTFSQFLDNEVNRLLVGTRQAPNWQGDFQARAYISALGGVKSSIIKQGGETGASILDVLKAQNIPINRLSSSLLRDSDREILEFLYDRSYDRLTNWTGRMSTEVRDIMFNGLSQGLGINDVAREIRARIDVSQSRAETIARTEINQAHSRAVINEAMRLRDEEGIEVAVRWITAVVKSAKGNPVRKSHAQVHGVIMTPERALGIKTRDGINCRCDLRIVVTSGLNESAQSRFADERARLLAAEAGGRASGV